MKMLAENKISLCKANSCCMAVEIIDNKIFLTDDYNGKVQITEDEASMLSEAIKTIKNNIKKT